MLVSLASLGCQALDFCRAAWRAPFAGRPGGNTGQVRAWHVRSKVMTELRSAFQRQLQTLEVNIVQLFAFAAEDLAVATTAPLNNDANGLKVVSERKAIIDGLYPGMEDLLNAQVDARSPGG